MICDLIEPFRTIIDRKIRILYRLNQISEKDFYIRKGRYSVNYRSKNNYGAIFAKEINDYSVCIFRYIQGYYRWFMTSEDLSKMPNARIVKNDSH